ncbi:MAG: hypothetical protein ACW96X_07765 [Promethearchaeota archaeon]|jgi:hypothetical protein
MAEEILKFTKLTFIIHSVIGLIFTILFFIPDLTVPIFLGSPTALTLETHMMSLTIASLFLGLTVSSILGILAKEWKQVKIVVICEIFWLIAAIVTTILSFAVFAVATGVLTVLVDIIMIALFCLTFLQQEDKLKPLF